MRGRIAELLAKAVDKGALDEELSAGRQDELMRQFLGALRRARPAERRL